MRCLTVTLILMALVDSSSEVADTKDKFVLAEDTLKCVISLSDRLGSSEGKGAGLSYEMLGHFGVFADAGMSIRKALPEESVLDSLKEGSIDLLVMVCPEDSSTNAIGADFYRTPLINNGICWITSKEQLALLENVNFWLADFMQSRLYRRCVAKYYRQYDADMLFCASADSVSPFDDIIKKYGSETGIDWLLLASIIYQESQYYIGAEYNDAKGLMQVKPNTAAIYGVDDLFNPSENIKAGSYYFKYLINKYQQEGLDSLNVIKFALAAYNAGSARIERYRDHALKNGRDPNDWDDVVASYARKGTFARDITAGYVTDIINRYDGFRNILKK